MAIGIKLITPPTTEPVTLAAAKEHIGIPASDANHDGNIMDALLGARQYIEEQTGRQFIAATWCEAFDRFPAGSGDFRPLKSPLKSVTTIAYTDTAGDPQTVADTVYTVDTYRDPGRIALAYQQAWPSTRAVINAVLLTYIAAYTVVPKQAGQAIKLLCAHWFDNPEPVLKTGAIAKEIPLTVTSLMNQLSDGNLV